jgi:hypothetical protein
MPKSTKEQKRRKKVMLERRDRDARARSKEFLSAKELKEANALIIAAVDIAVSRAVKELNIGHMAARAAIADIIENHLFMPVANTTEARGNAASGEFDQAAWQPPTEPIIHQPDAVLDESAAFDRDKWNKLYEQGHT